MNVNGHAVERKRQMSDENRLKALLTDVLLLEEHEYRDSTGPDDIETWDSLGTVRVVEAVHRQFGYRMLPEEFIEVQSIGDIKSVLRARGVFA